MNNRRIVQFFKYTLLLILFLSLIFAFAAMGWGSNTQGSMCSLYIWDGDKIIREITYNVWFQAMWDNSPCRFTSDYLFGFYFWTILLYLLFKNICRNVLDQSETLKINLFEVIISWSIYGGILLKTVHEQGEKITIDIVCHVLVGTFLLLYPLFILAVAVGKNEQKEAT